MRPFTKNPWQCPPIDRVLSLVRILILKVMLSAWRTSQIQTSRLKILDVLWTKPGLFPSLSARLYSMYLVLGGGRRRQALLMWMRMDYSKSCLPSPVWFAWLHMGSALLMRQALVSLTQNLVLSSFVSTARVCKCRGALTMKPFTMECLDFIEKSQSPPICHVALSTVVILDEWTLVLYFPIAKLGSPGCLLF